MIVGLKNNCSALLKAARQAFIDFPNEVSVFEFTDSRQILRQTKYLEISGNNLPSAWNTVTGFAMVRRVGIRYKDKKKSNKQKDAAKKAQKTSKYVCCVPCQTVMPTNEPLLTKSGKQRVSNAVYFDQTAYYAIVKPVENVQKVAQMIQNHWNIENKLHRNKDVVLNEDGNKIKNKNVVANLSSIFNFVLNVCVFHGIKSLTIAIEKYANQPLALFALMISTNNYKVNRE